jgi:hypothetical protein
MLPAIWYATFLEFRMQNVITRKAGEMSAPLRAAVEEMLGRAIADHEQIQISAGPAAQAPPPSDEKTSVVARLEALLNRREEKVRSREEAQTPPPVRKTA